MKDGKSQVDKCTEIEKIANLFVCLSYLLLTNQINSLYNDVSFFSPNASTTVFIQIAIKKIKIQSTNSVAISSVNSALLILFGVVRRLTLQFTSLIIYNL